MLDDEAFLVLNAIYLKKMATIEAVAQVLDVPEERVVAVVEGAQRDGLAIDLGGQFMLDEAGTQAVLEHYKRTYGAMATDAAIVAFYERFEQINAPFIKLVSDWQGSDGDERAKERILRLVERHIKALDEISGKLPRYGTYARRFERTIGRIDEGDVELVSNPRRDSLHNIWFEFHEDVLAVMGRPRTSS